MQTPSSTEIVGNVPVHQKRNKRICYCRCFCWTFKIPSGQEELAFGCAEDTLTFSQTGISVKWDMFYLCDSSSALCMPHAAIVLTVLKGSVDSWREQRIKMNERPWDGH